MAISFEDFERKTQYGVQDTTEDATKLANAFIKSCGNSIRVLNVETLTSHEHGKDAIRLWYAFQRG